METTYVIIAIPKRKPGRAEPEPQYAWHYDRAEAYRIAREQRGRGVFASVSVCVQKV